MLPLTVGFSRGSIFHCNVDSCYCRRGACQELCERFRSSHVMAATNVVYNAIANEVKQIIGSLQFSQLFGAFWSFYDLL